jgi:hypothetical protein
MVPELALMERPAGNPVAAKVSGDCPVAEIVNRNGLAGTEPTTDAPWIAGVAGAAAIEMVMSVWAAEAAPPSAIATTAAAIEAPRRPKKARKKARKKAGRRQER